MRDQNPLEDQTQQDNLNSYLSKLEATSSPKEQFLYRSLICEILKIPYHIHCKSSKDRTAVVAAIKKGVRQWLCIEDWKKTLSLPQDPKTLFNDPAFREYLEAALFENLPLTDQGVGFAGELGGKVYTQDRGFDFRFSLIENPLAAEILTDRHLYTAPIAERLLYTFTAVIVFNLILLPLWMALSPLILLGLAIKYKGQCLNAYKYIWSLLLTLPWSGLRAKWLDRTSTELQARRFFRTHSPKTVTPALQTLFDQVESLHWEKRVAILNFIETNNSDYIKIKNHDFDPEIAKVLKQIANQWNALESSYRSLPSFLQEVLVQASRSGKKYPDFLINL